MSNYKLNDYVYILSGNSLLYEGTVIAVDSKHIIVLNAKTNSKLVISLYDGFYKVIRGIKCQN